MDKLFCWIGLHSWCPIYDGRIIEHSTRFICSRCYKSKTPPKDFYSLKIKENSND